MNDEVIRSQLNPAQHLFAERGARLFEYLRIGRCEVDQIVAVNHDGRDSCFGADRPEALDLFVRQWTRHPPARIARKELDRTASELLRLQECVLQAAREGKMKAKAGHTFVLLFLPHFFSTSATPPRISPPRIL